MTAADRMWKIRDAVLAYLYEQYAEDNTVRSLDANVLSSAIGWTDEPIDNNEIGKALAYLMERGLVDGITSFGGGVHHPSITAAGQDFVARGLSVRGPVEGPQSVPSSIVINATGNTNLTIGSHHVTQSIESGDVAIDKAKAVATALEKAAAGEGVSAEAAAQARDLAAEINAAADQPEPDKPTIRALLGKALGTIVTSAGTPAGQEVITRALEAVALFT
ncbi:hypothetical protein O4215_20580 [Rhodococcus maanshanensis]|uniref:hypothetical protein n=1 Tax=Rhodococcus maanshanensis TaxID=183556 RepID=UPI0022B4A7DB|nr:hypothetical protein [Rhodococcus maanshanensis]MCZ4557961.1 hypothetical protein [Rhodococcus maanshanensis]